MTLSVSVCLAPVLVLVAATPSFAAVNEVLAKRWAAEALKKGEGKDVAKAEAALAKDWPADTVRDSWKILKQCRDAGNSLDLNLAAAEHYLFMRYLGNDSGDTSYRQLPKWYDTVKKTLKKADLEQILKTSNEPVSPPDPDVLKWGNAGVERGLVEYKSRTGKAPSAGGGALLTIMGTSYFTYYYTTAGVYSKLNGACAVGTPT
jgi:hypothetical protein